MPRAHTSQITCTELQGNAPTAPVNPARPIGSSRWSLSCRDTSGPLTEHNDGSTVLQCRPVAFANRPAWPPVGLSVTSDPRANWMARSIARRTPNNRII